MKTHIMRLAPQDLRTSSIRKRAIRMGRRDLWFLYQELLWALHEAGGELPSDPQALADELDFFTPDEIAEALPLLCPQPGKVGGIVVRGGRIHCPRLSSELAEEAAFSLEQAERGRRGARARSRARAIREGSERQASAEPPFNPPLPFPLPLPPPTPIPPPDTSGEKAPLVVGAGQTAPDRSQRELYASEIWTAFGQAAGKPERAQMSEVERDLVYGWHHDGVPLRIVLRAIEDCLGRGDRKPRSLLYLVPAVRDATEYWRQSLAGADLQTAGDQQGEEDDERPPPRDPT